MIGFANKGNAKRTLENNFVKGEDYIIRTEDHLLRKEKQKRGGVSPPGLRNRILTNVHRDGFHWIFNKGATHYSS
jgi:hypothetical protein